MDGVVEIIIGRERRRWSTEDKLRIVAEMAEPGTRVRAVAARHGVCESLLFTWRRQVCDGVLTALVADEPSGAATRAVCGKFARRRIMGERSTCRSKQAA